MSKEPTLVCVRTCQGWDLAQIFKTKLEAASIPVLLKYESAGLVFGLTVDGLGEVRIMVPEDYAVEARALLEDLDEPFPDNLEDMSEPPDAFPDEKNPG